MENTTYIALSKQNVLVQHMNKIAHNLANLNTVGFKSQHLIVTEHEVKADDRDADELKMVLDYGDYRDPTPGPIVETGNPFDFAIEGNGYFAVEHQVNRQTYYSRAGNFTLNNLNELVTPAGHKVLSGGAPIQIPQGVTQIEVTRQGIISTEENGEIGQIDLFQFENEEDLNESGSGLFVTNQEPIPAQGALLYQGALEQSNVNSIVEMTNMIEVSRQYQVTQRMIQTEHERMENAIRTLGNINV